ncbi:MAG TPA: D-alanyl-D-alanine carboxypeptidase [Solirubrobacteraceae bacterium]|nr:D-alanyl-D-alanine carboxypeptidase [Solirubrobacteraceae bacterium]
MALLRRPRAVIIAVLAATCALAPAPALAAGAAPVGSGPPPDPRATAALTRILDRGVRSAGSQTGAEVLDLNTGAVLYANRARTGRLPASVQKLWTTSTVLLSFGPSARLSTRLRAVGRVSGSTFTGTLYLQGGGDPTFGTAAFDHATYGTGATVQSLVSGVRQTFGIRAVRGTIIADESRFDRLRGTPATGYRLDPEVEGGLSALVFNRDWSDPYGSTLFAQPALEAGAQLEIALRAAGIRVPAWTPVRTGVTPATAQTLAVARSPAMATLVHLTNTPSDNFFAETLLKDLGAQFGAGGTTVAGAAVVRATIARTFGLRPRFDDGSGLSRYDRSSPADIVSLLRQQAGDPAFTSSLAIAGETGTLRHELTGTVAQGRCRGKTGTLTDASNVAGYCRAADGHTLAFAFEMNRINPDRAHPIQNAMELALVRYDG